MKPTKHVLQKVLFLSVIVCSLLCTIYMHSIHLDQANPTSDVTPNEQVEEVLMPDVFAVKNLIEKILKHLPAS